MKRNALTRPVIALTFILIITLSLSGCAKHDSQGNLAATDCISTVWPQENSELLPDPSLQFGILDNGLRYVIKENRVPEDRVGLYLVIGAGSLHEREDQRGIAHFLEHMLFNGTTHFPPGTLVEYFQSIGMGFGDDTNASTSFGETVYNLLLPSGEADVMADGLRVLTDYARGALLLEDEVDRERGIILAEKRARDSAWSRVSKEQFRFKFSGTLAADRDPIGTEDVITSTDSGMLRSYYDTWYRPDNMVVVAVGDMDTERTRVLIEQHFSQLKGAGLTAVCPQFGEVKETGTDILYLYEPETGHTRISLGTVFNLEHQYDTRAWERKQLQNYFVNAMFINRMDKLVNQDDSPFTTADSGTGLFLGRVGYATLSAETSSRDWREALTLLQVTLYQALEYGFTSAEYKRVKQELSAYLEKEVKTIGSRDTRVLARSIIWKLTNKEVILSPQQELDLYAGLMETITIDELNGTLDELWKNQRRLISVAGNAKLTGNQDFPEEVIRRAYLLNHAQQHQVSPWSESESVAFPYLPPPPAGKVVERMHHEDIEAVTYVLSNNIRFHFKQTDYKENELLFTVHFGGGKRTQPHDGMAMLAENLVGESGVGGLNKEQLQETLSGTNIGLAFRVGVESFFFNGRCLSEELELLLQLVYAKLYDPAFSPEAFRRSQRYIDQMYSYLANSVEGVYQLHGERYFAGGSFMYGVAPQNQVAGFNLGQVEQWLRPVFLNAGLEFTLVGDIDEKKALALVSKYFGGIYRDGLTMAGVEPVSFPVGEMSINRIDSSIDKALLTVAWKTDDFWSIDRTRRLNVLAAVLSDRLRKKIREELGATYSPSVGNHSSRVLPGFGMMRCQLTIDPKQAEMLVRVVHETAADLVRNGVTREELSRALKPTLTAIKDYRRTNTYWVKAVLALSGRHPQQLQWPQTLVQDLNSIQPDELNLLARKYLNPQLAAVSLVIPEFDTNKGQGK